MMSNISKAHGQVWLMVGLMAAALLLLAFQSGDTDPAHCRSCKPPTSTPTVTPTVTVTPPRLQACRISEIYLNQQRYQPGSVFTAPLAEPLEITLKLVDHQGQILIGANVDATVTQTSTVQAAAIPPLEDQSGTYDARYTLQQAGTYRFTFSASDFTGPRFLPCSAEALVEVEAENPPSCEISLASDRTQYNLGEPIQLTATLTDTLCTNGVTATIQIPGNGVVTRTLTGPANICTGSYPTTVTGTHIISATANSAGGTCLSNTIAPVVTSTVTAPVTPTIGLIPPSQSVELCGRASSNITSTLQITGVTNLAQVDLSLSYDPTFIVPSQITPLLGTGAVTETGNTIRYSANLSPPLTGTANLLNIDWRLQGRDGTTTIGLTSTLRNPGGSAIAHTTQNGTLEVIISPPCLRCTVNLQGRSSHSGATITNATGEQAGSYPNGLFAIASTGPLHLIAPGYLSTQLAAPLSLAESSTCRTTLLAGDVNQDNIVNILDLAILAGHYRAAHPVADLNASGLVDIFDLTLAAGNYQQQGR